MLTAILDNPTGYGRIVRGKPTRIGKKILEDGRKVRVCRKCEGVVDK